MASYIKQDMANVIEKKSALQTSSFYQLSSLRTQKKKFSWKECGVQKVVNANDEQWLLGNASMLGLCCG